MEQTFNVLGGMPGDLPMRVRASFEALTEHWEKIAAGDDESQAQRAKSLLAIIKSVPEFAGPFENLDLLDEHADKIEQFFEPIFPEVLQDNEIMGLSLPFKRFMFNPTRRMKGIMERSGEDVEITIRDLDPDAVYIMMGITILNAVYDVHIDHKMPVFFRIPDKIAGIERYYRAFFNVDFARIKENASSPRLTESDINLLINNYHDIDLWREKMPPFSYDYDGFSIIKLFDVTLDEALSSMKNILLRPNALSSAEHLDSLEENLRSYFNLGDLQLSMVTFDKETRKLRGVTTKAWHCNFMEDGFEVSADKVFCDFSKDFLFKNGERLVASDIAQTPGIPSELLNRLKSKEVRSYILEPLMYNNEIIGLLELSSKQPYALNSIAANKLRDIVPLYTIALRRAREEQSNKVDAVIQGEFTALHPSVSWKFTEVAEKILDSREKNLPDYEEEVVFRDVVPMYGQFDIRGSSSARNTAIQADLVKQLKAAEGVLEIAAGYKNLPIYQHLMFRIESCIDELKAGIAAGDEAKVREFLKQEVYPVFHFLESQNAHMKKAVDDYKSMLHEDLELVYEERKAYEDSVTHINSVIQDTIEEHQEQAQAMFPHYFEKFKTDGIEFNMYVGQSIANNVDYDPMYLSNLRIWQLQMSHAVEIRLRQLRDTLPVQLDIASLILVHNTPLAIKFRMDEMQFDVDGAYNIRYEIVKKRIDKAYIKGTEERLTQPGKIAVVYSHDDEGLEYRHYFDFMRSMNQIEGEVEDVELEDLQGASGLRALRAFVVYGSARDVVASDAVESMIEQLSK